MGGSIASFALSFDPRPSINRDFLSVSDKHHKSKITEYKQKIQEKCPHTFLLVSKKDTYLWSIEQREWGIPILALKKCIYCDFEVRRPPGNPWQTCHVCWGRMIRQDKPGIIGKQEKTFFACECCGHTTFK